MPLIPRQRDRRADSGYALLPVIGLGTAIVLTVGAVSGYALQSMGSAGRAQGFQAAVQAAQAGVDDFMARIQGAEDLATAAGVPAGWHQPDGTVDSGWQPIPGSVDADGTNCVTTTPRPANCPEFHYTAASADGQVAITSTGRSRGIERTVRVTTGQLSITDFLYFSQSEAADRQDGFVYPPLLTSPPATCNLASDEGRPAGCFVPPWRTGDSTDRSRVHTADRFEVDGEPGFNSRVTVADSRCATLVTNCVVEAAGSDPTYDAGPAFADDLTLPANPIAQIASAAGCTYYGPTRIRFEDDEMVVWSPQTPNTPQCGGGIPQELLDETVGVVVDPQNCNALANLTGRLFPGVIGLLDSLVCSLGLTRTASVTVSALITATGTGGVPVVDDLFNAVAGLRADGDRVAIPAAIQVTANTAGNVPVPPGTTPVPDPSLVQCLVGSALGMYTTIDTNLTAGLLNANGTIRDKCRAGMLFVDGHLDPGSEGDVTVGVNGDILIMSSLTKGSDDVLGLVATGPVEVYNPIQCALAAGTCLVLPDPGDLDRDLLTGTIRTALTGIRSAASTGNLNGVLDLLAPLGYGADVTVEAAILGRRFGMQLPVLSVAMNTSVLNQLVNLGITAPKLTVEGSVAQSFRGIVGADLLDVGVTVPGIRRIDPINVVSAAVDIGYLADYRYDETLRTRAPGFFPQPGTPVWERLTFAELDS